ncbi:MAG: transaldolase [Cyanobacteria bacterium J06635_15]
MPPIQAFQPKGQVTQPLIRALQQFGQSVWLDDIQRYTIRSGELHRLVKEEGIRGVISNLAIFQKAIADSTDYDAAFAARAATPDQDAIGLYEQLVIEDIQAAADILKPLYDQFNRQHGYVSLDVSPYLANDAAPMLIEARRLWRTINRPNLMVKVSATAAGIPVIQQLISEGINVNVTRLFSPATYRQVVEAYLTGLEVFAAQGGDVSQVASVASFFISRLDIAVDALITARLNAVAGDEDAVALLESLQGKVAIANAKLVYQDFVKLCFSDRWRDLAIRGAQPQRLLWSSTDTQKSKSRDVLYIEALIGPDTISTIPPSTFTAFSDHGCLRTSLPEEIESAETIFASLPQAEIDLQALADQLLIQGVQRFQQTFDQLLEAIEQKQKSLKGYDPLSDLSA